MSGDFDEAYWEAHWQNAANRRPTSLPAHPALMTELAGLQPGEAFEAGSGEGAEAIWLTAHGWNVTAADISPEAITRAERRAGADIVSWIEADLSTWEPPRQYDLVTTFYAHPAMPQNAFYERISHWVAPSGTLLIVGHHHEHGHAHAHHQQAVTAPDEIRALLAPDHWEVHTAEIRERAIGPENGHGTTLRDVVVRARRIHHR
ncbi:class I SAM-dependent methyltransferase [Microbacterium sp. NPDC089698]|uniref:class I SAM-dependent methyltransferase n=1 Tax=Microbacterium sp. NPDC089698 TaxID=3364200 RepID=UPI0038039192